MINKVVIGTLATLNSIISPLGKDLGDAGQPTYRFQLETSSLIAKDCRNGTALKSSQLEIRFDDQKDGSVMAHLSGAFCSADRSLHPISENFSLPSEALDIDFINDLPVDRPYVVGAGRQTRIKITKQKPVADLQSVIFEWVPTAANLQPLHAPMTVWLTKPGSLAQKAEAALKSGPAPHSPDASSAVKPGKGDRATTLARNPLHWSRVSFTYAHPVTGDAVAMTGDYAGIETPHTFKKTLK